MERPDTDIEDLEDVLVQVMNDEFDVVVDDGSAALVAEKILILREKTRRGEFAEVQALWNEYQLKKDRRDVGTLAFSRMEIGDDVQETDGDDDGDEEDDEDADEEMDVDMMDDAKAPALVRQPKENARPDIDEDGFTKVVGRRKR
jgi:pre-rRNA-processing protein TSR2